MTIYQVISTALCCGPLNKVEQRLYEAVSKHIENQILSMILNADSEQQVKLLERVRDRLLRKE